jgi:pimeloyl-ACP methyl ester carboxylesterase
MLHGIASLSPKEWLMEQDEVVTVIRGAAVRAFRGGQGRPIVLLHGGGLDSALLSWSPVWTALTGVGQVFAPDLPGFGRSDLGRTVPTLEGYREWLLAYLDAAGIPTAIVVGLSLGGGIALRTALDAPGRIEGMVLCAPYGISRRTPGGWAGAVSVHLPGAAWLSSNVLRHSEPLLERALRVLVRRPGSLDSELVKQARQALRAPRAGVAWTRFQRHEVTLRGPRTYWRAELATVRAPTLLMSGTGDTLVPGRDVRAAAERLPNGSFEAVSGAGHWLPRDAPGQVTEAVAQLRLQLTDQNNLQIHTQARGPQT